MKTLIASFLFTLAFSVSGLGQKCAEYAVPNSSFSFCPPSGWAKKQEPNGKGVSFERPEAPNTIQAGIMLDHDTIAGPRDALAYQLIQGQLKTEAYSNTRLLIARDFDTASGVKGTQLVFFFEMNRVPFVQAFYIFDGPKDTKLTFTLTGPQADKDIGGIVDTSMKTVRLK